MDKSLGSLRWRLRLPFSVERIWFMTCGWDILCDAQKNILWLILTDGRVYHFGVNGGLVASVNGCEGNVIFRLRGGSKMNRWSGDFVLAGDDGENG